MRVPRLRRSRAKGRRKDRRDAISTRLGRLEPKQTTPPGSKAAARAAAAGRRAQPRIDWLVTLVPRAILWAGRTLVAFAGILSSVATRLSRVITPERGIAGVIVCSAACLGVSQFVTYRGVEVGEPQYLGVSGVAPAPQTDRIDAGAAHAYLLIPVAVVAVVLAVIAVHGGRWRLGRLVALAGLAGVAVSLAIDQHSIAVLLLAIFAFVAVVVCVVSGSRPAAYGVAAAGVAALLIFLLRDLPDAGKAGSVNFEAVPLADATNQPVLGFWIELA